MDYVVEISQVVLTSALSLITLFLATKFTGKRQIAQMSTFDYVNSITIGSIAAELATNLEEWFRPFSALLIYALGTYLVHYFCCKSLPLRIFFSGRAITLMENGTIYKKELEKSSIDLNEFLSQARIAGYFDLNQIEHAQLETNGQISFLPKSNCRPVTTEDLALTVAPESAWVDLILDGSVQLDNLKRSGKERAWLGSQLSRQGIGQISEVFYAACDKEGNFFACRGK